VFVITKVCFYWAVNNKFFLDQGLTTVNLLTF
jgi:hypothetical protein